MCVGHILPQILITRVQQRWLAKRKRLNRLIWWWCGKFVQSDVGGIFLGASKKKKKNRIRSPSTVSQPAPKVGQSVWPSPPYSNQPLTPFFIGITITVVVLLIYLTECYGGMVAITWQSVPLERRVCPLTFWTEVVQFWCGVLPGKYGKWTCNLLYK